MCKIYVFAIFPHIYLYQCGLTLYFGDAMIEYFYNFGFHVLLTSTHSFPPSPSSLPFSPTHMHACAEGEGVVGGDGEGWGDGEGEEEGGGYGEGEESRTRYNTLGHTPSVSFI